MAPFYGHCRHGKQYPYGNGGTCGPYGQRVLEFGEYIRKNRQTMHDYGKCELPKGHHGRIEYGTPGIVWRIAPLSGWIPT